MTDTSQAEGTAANQPTIFFSYSRTDQKRALPLVAALEDAGYTVWWDGLLEGGQRFLETTENALESARAVVVLWTPTSVNSHWVHDEATRGRDRGCLVPLAMDGAMPPLGFRQFQTITITDGTAVRDDPAIAALIRAVAAQHDGPPAPRSGGFTDLSKPKPLAFGRRTVIGGAAVVAGTGILAGWWTGLIGGSAAAANSVAIMPFDNLSGDAAKAYFTDGLAAEVRTRLSRNPLLKVAAQTSSNAFRESDTDAREISRALRVNYLLEGRVQLAGETLRISLELVNGGTGFGEWSETYDRPTANLFAVQDEIAKAVTAELTREIASGSAPEAAGTNDLAAYDAYLRGRDQFDNAVDLADDQAALANFDAALATDPNFALAHAARSRSLTVIGNQYDQGEQRRLRYIAAIEAAQKAVELAPESAQTQSALGFALFNGKIDAKAARAPYEKSYRLGSGDADVVSRYALFSARSGRFEEARRAIAVGAELDPLNARIFRQQGEVEYSARAYAASIPPIERSLELNPKLSVAHSAIGASKLMLGDVAGAKAAYLVEPSALFRLTGLAIIARREGDAAAAETALTELIADSGDNSLYQQAQVLAQWGEGKRALDALQRAQEEGDAGLVYLRNDPFLDPLREEAQFKTLLAALGFD
ncbi:TIR domain-containing protein [Allopontixanthobacter sediminis]|uniref:TIR domain-containing protein n=1 Tax=Allopontixanthobacter sediminis TaxID=1689985 RepID=A0A845AYZ7_9SPHN|nr:TIR domain-containing protein [Allopontixanthobacter sediminis]MXP43094.1 TIR domain-containing protein [Allopontixanthobacter sediminis]